jgi:hypothetical protein
VRTGAVLWRGRSRIDGGPTVAILTGFRASRNEKTGPVLQTYILRSDVDPLEASRSGLDRSICGDCRHRSRSCYVVLMYGPLGVWKAYRAGSYLDATRWRARRRELADGRKVRLGTYGDPAAVPAAVWRDLLSNSSGWTGYSHQWRARSARSLRGLCMASVDTLAEGRAARADGWRTFRVRRAGSRALPNEVVCPASKEAGRRTDCARCGLCKGTSSGARSVVITVHGSRAGSFQKG